MRVQRTIRVILSALLTVTLCFCMIGCQPSEEEIKKKELEGAKRTRIEQIEQVKKDCHTRIFETYCGKKTLYSESDYHTYCAFYAVCEKVCEEEKAEIEKIEDIEDLPDFNIFREKIRNIPFCGYAFSSNCLYDTINFFLIKTETEDGIAYEIITTYRPQNELMFNSHIEVESADNELEVEYKVKLYFENGEEREYTQADNKRRALYQSDYERLYNSNKDDCVEIRIGITVVKKGEIIGYTLLGGSAYMSGLKVLKSAAIKPESRGLVTKEKAAEYLRAEDVEAEKRDGIRLRASEVEYRLWYYSTSQSKPSGITEITFRQGKDDAGKIYNEAIFYKYKSSDLSSYECWADGGRIEANGKQVDRIILSEDKEDAIRWDAESEDIGYLNIVRKNTEDSLNRRFLLLKTKKLDEEVYEGNLLMPEIYVKYGLGFEHIPFEGAFELVYSDNYFATYIDAVKNNDYNRRML